MSTYPIEIDRKVMGAVAAGRVNATEALCWGVINDLIKRGKRPTNEMIQQEMGRSAPSVSGYVKSLKAAGLLTRKLGRGPSTFDTRPWMADLPNRTYRPVTSR